MKRIIIAVFFVFLLIVISLVFLLKNNFNSKKISDTKVVLTAEVNISNDCSLYFDFTNQSVLVGDDFVLYAMINPGKKEINAATLHFTFDQTKLKLESIYPSENFSLVLANAVIDNIKGMASIDVAVPLTSPSITDISKMVTLNFRALGSVIDSQVNYTFASQAAADGEVGDVIKNREKALVTIIF